MYFCDTGSLFIVSMVFSIITSTTKTTKLNFVSMCAFQMMKTFILNLCVLPLIVLAQIDEHGLPQMLQDCYSGKPSITSKEDTAENCLETYLTHLFGNKSSYHGLDRNALNWVDSLGQRLSVRLRIQSSLIKRRRHLRIRKEIRTLSERERNNFFGALIALKEDTVR